MLTRLLHLCSHDQILSELTQRRKTQWKQLYAGVNLKNEPNQELAKFQWLRKQDIISEMEYQEAVGIVIQHHRTPVGDPAVH